MSHRIALSAVFFTALTGCQTVWELTQDDDGDGVTVAQGDCWDAAKGPQVTLPSGETIEFPSNQIYAGAVDLPYDGVDADCGGNDDFDLDGDGYVPLEAFVGLPTLGVADSGTTHVGAGDCFDAPNDIVEEGQEAALAAYALHSSAQAGDLSVDLADLERWVAMGEAAAQALGTSDPLWVIAVPSAVTSGDTNPVSLDQLRPDEVFPDAALDAWYDGIDVDCDGAHEFDQDADGYTSAHHSALSVVDWLDGATSGQVGDDCIDSDGADPSDDPNPAGVAAASVNPGQDELYWTGTDDDCSAATIDCDFDQDGSRGDPTVDDFAESACDFADDEQIDCDDQDASAVPNDSEEIFYNGVDENCDFADRDGDIDGDGYFTVDYCTRVDCDNLSPTVTLPNLDENFDCWDDPDNAPVDWPADAPGAFQTMTPLAGFAALTADQVNSKADDRPYDGVDQDCMGWINAVGEPADFDWDGDTDRGRDDFTSDASALTGGDCLDCPDSCYDGTATGDFATYCADYCPAADTNPAGLSSTEIYSGAYEEPYDGTDADCDDWSDYDVDRDGFDNDAFGGTDCYEGAGFDSYTPPGSLDPALFYNDPSAENPNEVIGDGLDHNCDDQEVCYEDTDDDGFLDEAGDTLVSTTNLNCTDANEGTNTDPTTDCDDDDAGDYPGATEIVGNEDDEDCDNTEICYLDDDNDGYRPNATSTIASADVDCQDEDEATSAAPTTDCDDDASTCNTDCSTDSDSDGLLDCVDACDDVDEDDYGTNNTAAASCVDGDGSSCVADAVCDGTDCNDNASTCTVSADCSTDDDDDGISDCVDLCLDDDGDQYGDVNTDAQGCVGSGCDLDATCTATDCDDDASTCNADCSTDSDDDGFADCQDACTDADIDDYGVTLSAALSCLDASGASCVLDAACTATDCDDDASTCNTDCSTDADSDGFADCQDACDDDDGDNYGATNTAATACLDASGASCVLDAACTATDCDDDASTCNTDCSTDADSDGFADCQDACDDNDGDNYGLTNASATACLDASGASCVLDAACTATDCDDDATTCNTDCSTDSDSDGFADCQDACEDDDGDNYGLANSAAAACLDASGASCVLDATCIATDCNDDATTCNTDCTSDADSDGFADCWDACDDDDGDNYGVTNTSATACLEADGTSCVRDAACTATDCDDDASTCNTDCSTDADSDGFADCQDACDDDDGDNYGLTNASASSCVDASGASCVLDAACTATDCDDDATTCNTDCATDSDSDGFADCQDACDDDDGDNYGATNTSASSCLDASGASCVLDAACVATDCDDDASTCNTDCSTDADSDGFADCQDACDDDDGDNYGLTNASASSCLDASGASCVLDPACAATDCDDDASTCNTDCVTDTDADGFADCEDACEDADGDGFGTDNASATACVTASGAACSAVATCAGTDCDDDASTCASDCATDTDSDGVVDCQDACEDLDFDDYGIDNNAAVGCLDASGASCTDDAVCTDDDCDDGDGTINPGRDEGVTTDLTIDGVDNDCDDYYDEGLLVAGDLIITEVMINPSGGDSTGEWFEVYNASGYDLVLGEGWTAGSDSNSDFSITGPLSIADGDYLVFARGIAPTDNHGFGTTTADQEWSGSLLFNNSSADDVTLSFDDPINGSFTMTSFEWNQAAGFTLGPSSGASLQLDFDTGAYSDETDSANWCDATSFIDGDSGLDLGTPGADNDTCP